MQPVQQFRHTTEEHAIDSDLISDAMDSLHSCPVGGCCISCSDDDVI